MGTNNLTNLAKNIQDTVAGLAQGSGITTLFQDSKAPTEGKYPGVNGQDELNAIDPANWIKSYPYTFSVMPTDENSVFSDFPLPINPSDINQSDSFAINITPTQGGTAIQHGGNKYGDLSISGTTGVHPNMGAGGVNKLTGQALLQPDQLKYKSGFEVFQRLHNWFKAYYQKKATDPDFKNYNLVFKNFKDGEFLIVELLKFTKKRTSGRPHFYDYNLDFKILGRINFKPEEGIEKFFLADTVIATALQSLDSARGVFLKSQDLLRQIEGTYESTVLEGIRKATLAAKAFTGIGIVAADMSKKAIRETVSSEDALNIALGIQARQELAKTSANVANSITSLKLPKNLKKAAEAQGADLILNLGKQNNIFLDLDSSDFPEETQVKAAQEQEDTLNLPRSYYEDAKAELIRVLDNSADKFGLGSAIYNAQYNRTDTSISDTSLEPTDEEIQLLGAFEDAILGLDLILSSTKLFTAPYAQRIKNFQANFSDGYPQAQTTQAVKEYTVPTNTDLERIALETLGNPDRWVEIVELNDLKPPYISQDLSDTTENIARPGDKILIPTSIKNGFGTTPTVTDRFINEDLSPTEKNLGVDFKFTENYDLAISNKGDLELIRGIENAIQAIMLKLFIEKGELLEHPELGTGIEVGSKGQAATIIKTNLVQTLSRDPRFESVLDLQILRLGSELRLNFKVKIQNIDQAIPISVSL